MGVTKGSSSSPNTVDSTSSPAAEHLRMFQHAKSFPLPSPSEFLQSTPSRMIYA